MKVVAYERIIGPHNIYASNKYIVLVATIFLQTGMLYRGGGGEILGL